MVRVLTNSRPVIGGRYIATSAIVPPTGPPRVLVDEFQKMADVESSTKKALRWSVERAAREYDGPIEIYCPRVERPQLEIGRLPPTLRSEMQRRDASVLKAPHNKVGNKLWKVVNGLGRFFNNKSRGHGAPTLSTEKELEPPLEVYTDGAYNNREGMGVGYLILGDNGGLKIYAKNPNRESGSSRVAESLAVQMALSTIKRETTNCQVDIHFDWNGLKRIFNDTVQDCDIPSFMSSARVLTRQIGSISVKCIDREMNKGADALAQMGRYMDFSSSNGIESTETNDETGTERNHKYAALV